LVPWLIPDASAQVLLFTCLFNALMLYCIANSAGTMSMFLSGALPIAVLDTLVLTRHEGLGYAAVGFPIMLGVITIYGARHRAMLRAGMMTRYAAEDLARDLEANQQRLLEVEHDRTLLRERERLTRDMHDGLGSALVGSLVAVERGEIRPERLAAMLRECVDDLRSVIDSLEPIDHDLVALLSSLRYRFQARLDAAGLLLEWKMEDLPALTWLGAPEALHVMRIMQELLSNVIKHAAANRIHVDAHVAGDEIEVSIVDDGHGFDPAATPNGRGVPSLRQRAALLDGSIHIDSKRDRGTRVSLRLPIVRIGKLI
jgi:signal transduction histidine kinase